MFISDLMVGIFLVLTDVISKITITWDTGDVGCKIVKFLQAMSTYASTYSLLALSIDRLDVVIRPLNRAGNSLYFICSIHYFFYLYGKNYLFLPSLSEAFLFGLQKNR